MDNVYIKLMWFFAIYIAMQRSNVTLRYRHHNSYLFIIIDDKVSNWVECESYCDIPYRIWTRLILHLFLRYLNIFGTDFHMTLILYCSVASEVCGGAGAGDHGLGRGRPGGQAGAGGRQHQGIHSDLFKAFDHIH